MNNNSEFMPVECLNVPKVLFYDKQYEDLSMDAKLIYALLLDRKEMAIRNEWVDEYGDTYVIYPKQEIKKYLNDYSGTLRATCPDFESHHSGEWEPYIPVIQSHLIGLYYIYFLYTVNTHLWCEYR